jgi:hypothetical protein
MTSRPVLMVVDGTLIKPITQQSLAAALEPHAPDLD